VKPERRDVMQFDVHPLLPPYDTLRSAASGGQPTHAYAIHALVVAPHDNACEAVEMHVAELRCTAPGQPVVFWLPDGPDPHQLPQLAALMAQTAVRGLILGQDASTLRPQLTRSTGVAGGIARWVADVRGIEDRHIVADLHSLMEQATRHSTTGVSVRRLGGSDRTWRAHFRDAGLPSPGRWVHMTRCLLPAFALQRELDRSVADVAEAFGFYDASRLAARCRSTFGIGPTGIRELLGFEPLLAPWLRSGGPPHPAPKLLGNRQPVAGIVSPGSRDADAL
jgi:AraC-like DNA-binding protein